MNYKIGDRIELVRMGPDPDPIASGIKGTIDFVNVSSFGTQIGVDWDNGRKLMVVLPEDTIRKIN